MKAMILAAGRGERMRPLTDDTPKPLLQAGGKTLVVWQIERVAAAGIADIVINHAHFGSQIEQALGSGERFGVRIEYSREAEPLDTAGGVASALPLLGAEPFLLLSGDVFTTYPYANLTAVARQMRGDTRSAHLVMIETQPPPPYDFGLDGDGCIVRSGTPRFTFAGMGVFRPAMFAKIGPKTRSPLLPLLLHGVEQRAISGELFSGQFANLTTPADLEELERRLRA